jgi:cytochrome c-type biogenesis protein CcmF
MDIGALLLYLALILALGSGFFAFLQLISHKKGDSSRMDVFGYYSKLTAILLFITVTVTLLLLYIYFITSNMDIRYVWDYSTTKAPLEYKMSGVLAGIPGSLLFWIWCIVLPWFVEEIIDLKTPKNQVLMALTRAIMMIISIIFISFLITRDLFAPTSQADLVAFPDGYGLNPLLQTPLMVIHPPIVFLAYGFVVICMAASMAYLLVNDKQWVKISISWSRWAWLFLTLGIGVGGLWAYVVLGWGGYWAWDPVETSSFLPWILLTAFLHAQLMYKRKGDYEYAAPALGIYTFVLVIFATFTTRAGGIWQSVHAFEAADVETDAFVRFTNALNQDVIIMGYFVLMVGLAVIGALLLIWALIKRGGLEEDDYHDDEKGILETLITDKNLMFASLILFTISTIVTLFLLILSVNGADRNQFDTKVGFIAMVGMIFLAVCLIWKHLGLRVTFFALICTGVVSMVLIFLNPDHFIVAATMPILVMATVASIYKIVRSINRKSLRGSLNGIAPHLAHLGIVFIMMGFVGSNFLNTQEDVTLDMGGQAQKIGDYDLKMVEGAYDPFESEFVKIEISKDGELIGYAEPGYVMIYKYLGDLDSDLKIDLSSGFITLDLNLIFEENGWFISNNAQVFQINQDRWIIQDSFSEYYRVYKIEDSQTHLEVFSFPQMRSEIDVENTPYEDIYFTYNRSSVSGTRVLSVSLIVKTLPLINLLWAGMWLLAIGIVMRLFVDYTRPKPKIESMRKKRTRSREDEEDDKDYYEDLIEKELEDMD